MSAIDDKFTIDETRRQEAVRQQWESGQLNQDIPTEKERLQEEDKPLESDISPVGIAATAADPIGMFLSTAGSGLLGAAASKMFPGHPIVQHLASLVGSFAGGLKGSALGGPTGAATEAANITPEEQATEAFQKLTTPKGAPPEGASVEELTDWQKGQQKLIRESGVSPQRKAAITQELKASGQTATAQEPLFPGSGQQEMFGEHPPGSQEERRQQIQDTIADLIPKVQKFMNADGLKDLDAKLGFANKLRQMGQPAYSALVNAQLMNPRIVGEKILTDAINLPVQIAFKGLGTGIVHGPTAGLKTALAGLYAYRTSVGEGLQYAATSFGKDEPAFQKAMGMGEEGVYGLESAHAFDDSPAAASFRWLGSAYGVGRRGVMASDQFSKTLADRAELHMNSYIDAFNEADKQGLVGAAKHQFADQYAQYLANNPTDALLEKTKQNTFRDTFTDQSKLVQNLSQLADDSLIIRLLVPYVRTPMNLIKEGFTYSPLAFFTESGRNDWAAGGVDRASAVAKAATGSALQMLIGYETAKGNITGEGPQGRGKEFWPGRDHPMSINIPGIGWTSYKYLGPYAQVISMAADATEMYHMAKDPQVQDKILDTSARLINHFINETPFLESVANLTKAFGGVASGEGTKALSEFAGREISGFIPAPIRMAAEIENPAVKQASTFMDQLKEKVPYYSSTLPLKYDWQGRPTYPPVAMNDGELMTWGGRLLNQLSPVPLYGDSKPPDPVEQEFAKHNVTFNQIPDHLSAGKGADPVGISPQYQEEWAQSMSQPLAFDQNVHDYAQDRINSDVYQHSPDWKQAETLQSIVHGYRYQGQLLLRHTHPEIDTELQDSRNAAIDKINQAAAGAPPATVPTAPAGQ